jgi:Leucine-rich repeat (LRR) protein
MLLALDVSHNQLTFLDVSQDTLLNRLYAANNQITELNVSNNSVLIELRANNNNLNCLNVQNGNNGSAATNLWWVGAKFNPNLVCIQVDNVFWANNNWVTGPTGNIDPGVVFSLNCPNSCDISVGITELEVWPKELLLYPNPTDGNFTIDLGVNYESATVRVTDINGKLIQSFSYNDHQLLDIKIEEPAGVYLLMLESGDKKSVIRIVKE